MYGALGEELLALCILQAHAQQWRPTGIPIYSASTEAEAEFNLELKALEMGCALSKYQQVVAGTLGQRDPAVCLSRGHSASVIYTTNAIESVNMTLRKVPRNHRIFSSDEAVYKVVYLAMRNLAKKWTMPIHNWKPSMNRFAMVFAERFPQ